jgi:hypothetical protein
VGEEKGAAFVIGGARSLRQAGLPPFVYTRGYDVFAPVTAIPGIAIDHSHTPGAGCATQVAWAISQSWTRVPPPAAAFAVLACSC